MKSVSRGRSGAVRVAHLHKLLECVQVAAVCYRLRGKERGKEKDVEFLLVRTRGRGLWTFPKGGTEPGLTHAQAAALEAFEEAGVHGRMEEESFARYVCRKQGGAGRLRKVSGKSAGKSEGKSAEKNLAVSAHLCEVRWLGKPEEAGRERTWFSAEKARERLREGRRKIDGETLARVLTRAVTRIQRIDGGMTFETVRLAVKMKDQQRNDALRRVPFEAAAMPYLHREVGRAVRPVLRVDGELRRGMGEQKLFRVQ